MSVTFTVAKIPWQKQPHGGRVCFGSQLRVQLVMVGNSWQQELDAAGHMQLSQEPE